MAPDKGRQSQAREALAAQVRQAAGARASDVQEADRLARLIARQLQEAGPAKAAGLHRLGQASLARLTAP